MRRRADYRGLGPPPSSRHGDQAKRAPWEQKSDPSVFDFREGGGRELQLAAKPSGSSRTARKKTGKKRAASEASVFRRLIVRRPHLSVTNPDVENRMAGRGHPHHPRRKKLVFLPPLERMAAPGWDAKKKEASWKGVAVWLWFRDGGKGKSRPHRTKLVAQRQRKKNAPCVSGPSWHRANWLNQSLFRSDSSSVCSGVLVADRSALFSV